MATTKKKMTIQEYIEAYRKYVGYYNEMATGVDFELLKNIDILDCSKINEAEKTEIEKFTKKLQKLDENLKGGVNAYKAAYDFKDDDNFEFCRNIVKSVYIQYHTSDGFTVFYEGILEFKKKKYNLRNDIFKYNLFNLGVILKDIYVSNIELLQNFIEFLNEVILKNMTNDNIAEIKSTNATVNAFISKIAKNLLIKDNHKYILNASDDSKYERDGKEFFNNTIKPLETKIDKSLFGILKDKYYKLFNIKNKIQIYIFNTIRNFSSKSIFQDVLFEKECANLFKLPPYQINKGNKALFEEFLYTVASLINLFYTNVDLKPFKDVNLLTIASFTDAGLFDKYQFIYNTFLPFIEEEKKFYTEVKTYVTSNAASFDTIKLTEVKNLKNQKDYSYIEYILESLNFVKEMFIEIMNILYTMSSMRLNTHGDDTIKFLNTLINNIPFIFDMLKFLTFEMYEIIIFQENKTLSFDLIKNFKYFSYYDETSNKYVEINSQEYNTKVTDFINDVNQDSSFSEDYKNFLTVGYDIKDDISHHVLSTDPNYYGVVGFYFFTIELYNFYNIIVENIDNFKNDTVGFKYRSKTYNFQGFLKIYKKKYIGKNSKVATGLLDEIERIYNQNNTPSVQTKKPAKQSTTIKSASSSLSLSSTLSSSKPLSSSTKPNSSSSLLSKSDTQTPSVSSTSKPVKKSDTRQLDSSYANSPFDDYQGSSGDELKNKLYYLHQKLGLLSQRLDQYKISDNSQSYLTRLHKITDYRNFKTQTDREPQDFIAQIKLKNIGGKQNISKYNYITEDSLGKAVNSNRARELANNYNQLTDKMIETEKKIGGIQKLALNDLNKSESGYIRMRGGEQQTLSYNNLIKQYQLMAIKQNNIINEIKNIKNIY